jgi:hypothetical protein
VNTVPSEYEAAWQPWSGTIGIDIAWQSGKPVYESEFVARRSVIKHVKAEKIKYFSIQCYPISFWEKYSLEGSQASPICPSGKKNV